MTTCVAFDQLQSSGSICCVQIDVQTHELQSFGIMAKLCSLLKRGVWCCSCSETTELYVLYSLDAVNGKPTIRSSVKRNAFLQQPDASLRSMLHVVEGDAGNLHDAFCELSTFFDPGYMDPDLPPFMQALSTTQVCCSQSQK